MKSTTLPSLRVDSHLREEVESLLLEDDGETLSRFIETLVQEQIERRRVRSEFIARSLLSRDEAKRAGIYHSAGEVQAKLARMLTKTSARVHG